ncbi:MAG: hypothetical protein ACR2OY_09355 [Boseongicola sp.]
MFRWLIIVAGLVLSGLPNGGARAQSVSVVPDGRSLVILLRETLIGLDQANRTGNYGVFRDLGSPRFRNANTEARLGQIFSDLRKQNVDMRTVSVLTPRFAVKPFVDKKNLLRMAGVFDTPPRAIRFDLAFELSGGTWKLFGIAVNPVKPNAATSHKGRKKR